MNIFEVNSSDIECLDAKQLTELLSKLLYLEANEYGIPKSNVNCSLNITIPDGGEDGSIKWDDGPNKTNWFKGRYNLFQCKATDMPPKSCEKEIIYKDKSGNIRLKPQVEKVFEEGGCYILFCNKSSNPAKNAPKIEAFRKAIKEAGKSYYNTAKINIYDCDKITEWTNCYLGAVMYVLKCRGIEKSVSSLLTWQEWSGYQQFKYNYETDEEIEKDINQLRELYSSGTKKVARIIGLSGLGKTRMALETFKEDENDIIQSTINKNVAYIEVANNDAEIIKLFRDLRRRNMAAIIVVDNCSIHLHDQLEKEVMHSDSRLSLLTLDYNIEKGRGSYPIIELKKTSDEIIKKIIKQSYETISDEDIERIIKFAEGFPQMAVLLAEARLNDEETIGQLNDTDLAKKLLWGREERNEEKYEFIKGCAIFENFKYDEGISEQVKYIAKNICDNRINEENYYKYANYFVKRGILDKRGRFLAVTPQPLAVRLAAEWWQECNPEKGKKVLLSEMPGNMVEYLCNQISKLQFVEEARSLTRNVCDCIDPFDQAEVLFSKRGGRIFRALAEVNPLESSEILYNILKNIPLPKLKEISQERRELIWALERLCFWKDSFYNSVKVLLMLAATENEHWSNNATGIAEDLFNICSIGTQAEPKERLNVIDEMLESEEDVYIKLAIKLLGNGIKIKSVSSISMNVLQQGTRATQKPWRARVWEDIFNYWKEIMLRLTNISLENNDISKLSMEEISRNFNTLIHYGRIDDLDKCLQKVGEHQGYKWPDMFKAIKGAVKHYKDKIPKVGIEKLNEWFELFKPKELSDKLKYIVCIPDFDVEEDEKGRWVNLAEEKSKEFARECIDNIELFYEFLDIVFEGEVRVGNAFGQELAISDIDIEDFIKRSMECLRKCKVPNPNVLIGVLSKLREADNAIVDKYLDIIAQDKELNKYICVITKSINMKNSDISRIIRLIKENRITILSLKDLIYGVWDDIDIKILIDLLKQICKIGLEGRIISLYILDRIDVEKDLDLEKLWIDSIVDIDMIHNLDKYLQMSNYNYIWYENLQKLVSDRKNKKYLKELYNKILVAEFKCLEFNYSFEENHQRILGILIENNPSYMWGLFEKTILSANETEIEKVIELLEAQWLHLDDGASLIEFFKEEDILKSLGVYGKKFAQVMVKVIRKYDTTGDEKRFNIILRTIIEQYGAEDENLLEWIFSKMGPMSFSGSLVPYYKDKIEVLSEYSSYKNTKVRGWAIKCISGVKKQIENIKIREEEEKNGIF
ncbi:MAG: hypothetical protein E7214_13130 [Clostridium sp.]|nr:hypothetical protein [Clostridium sp.]